MLAHTGERLYVREVCNEKCTGISLLQRHRRTLSTDVTHTLYESNSSYSANKFELCTGTKTQCLDTQKQSIAKLHVSVRIAAFSGTVGVIDEAKECLSRNMHPDSSGKLSSFVKVCHEECLSMSITKSRKGTKSCLEKLFGCGICGEMLDIEKEFQDHCHIHRFSPPDDLVLDMF